jgi:hypothetical protein
MLIARARELTGLPDRLAMREIPEQVAALLASADHAYEADSALTVLVLELRSWAMYFGPEHPDTQIARGQPRHGPPERRPVGPG